MSDLLTKRSNGWFVPICGCLSALGCEPAAEDPPTDAVELASAALRSTNTFHNQEGMLAHFSSTGPIDSRNEFFQGLGTNGRACVTCHAREDGFSITPTTIQERFERCESSAERAKKPRRDEATACAIFRTNDGSNSPKADVSTKEARRAAYSMLLARGVFRIGIGVPADADFDVIAIDDPYGFATTSELSLFRRPLPATNLPFHEGVMWDLRETSETVIPGPPFLAALSFHDQLRNQALHATERHAQLVGTLTDSQLQSIVDFELGLFSAQALDFDAGFLASDGATAGVMNLFKQPVTPNAVNTFVNGNTFTPIVFTLFDAWAQEQGDRAGAGKRASIARGQALFNARRAPPIPGRAFDPEGTSCGICHNAFNVGTHSNPVTFPQVKVSTEQFRTPDMPLYTLECSAAGMARNNCAAGARKLTTDPGRGLITGAWRDIDAFKVPALRNLAAHPPYFHDGSAATLKDVVKVYEETLQFDFTDMETEDLVNFMNAL